MARKPREEDYTKISVRVANKTLETIDKLCSESERDRSGEINVGLKFYSQFASEALKRGMTPDELQQWLFREVAELSEKYDKMEELIEKIVEKK